VRKKREIFLQLLKGKEKKKLKRNKKKKKTWTRKGKSSTSAVTQKGLSAASPYVKGGTHYTTASSSVTAGNEKEGKLILEIGVVRRAGGGPGRKWGQRYQTTRQRGMTSRKQGNA